MNQQLLKNFLPRAAESVKHVVSRRGESHGVMQVGVTQAKVAVRFRVCWADLGVGSAVGLGTAPVPAINLLLFFHLQKSSNTDSFVKVYVYLYIHAYMPFIFFFKYEFSYLVPLVFLH